MNAVCYARFSSANQREESVTAQLRAIHDYAQKIGIRIIKEYIDEAKSATTDDRPQFLQMIDEIYSGRIQVDYVYVHKLDRFARNRYDSAIYRHKLNAKGVKLIAVTQPLDDSPEGVIMEALLEAMAEYYSKNLGREVQKGMKETALQARHTGGQPPLGYSIDPATKKYIVDEHEAEVVKEIYNLVVSGKGYSEVITTLNRKGFKTKNGNPFGKNSIYEILKNEKYTGVYVFNKTANRDPGKRNNHLANPTEKIIRIPNAIPAIIPCETWESVQLILTARKKGTPRRHGQIIYFLTGKLFCGECGCAYTGNSQIAGRNKKKYYLYTCSGKKRTKVCVNKNIRKEIIEDYLLDEIENLFTHQNVEELARKLAEQYKEKNQNLNIDFKQSQESLREIQQKMDRLFNGIETGTLDSNVAGPRLNTLAKEKNILETRLMELRNNQLTIINHEQIINFLEANRRVLNDRSNLSACKKLIESYIEKVVLFKDDIEVILKVPCRDADKFGGGGGS